MAILWTDEELNYIREHEALLESEDLPLSQTGDRDARLSIKLNLSLAILRGESFKLLIYESSDPEYRVVYLTYSTANTYKDGKNIAFSSFKKSQIDHLEPEAKIKFLLFKILDFLPNNGIWVKLVSSNLNKVLEV